MIDSNSTRRTTRRQSQEPSEEPKRHQFQDRPYLQAFIDGELTRAGYITLNVILSFTSRGFMCYASDTYMANAARISRGRFANELSHLVKSGWVKRTWEEGVRRLEPSAIVHKKRETPPQNQSNEEPTIHKKRETPPPDHFTKNVKQKEDKELNLKREENAENRFAMFPPTPLRGIHSTEKITPTRPDNAVSVPATRARTGNVDQERVNCHTHRLNVEMGHPIAKQEIHRNGATPPVERTASVDKQTTNPGATVVDELLPPISSPLDKSPGYSDFDVQLTDRILRFIRSNNWITYGKRADRELALAVFRRKNKVTEAEMLARWEWYEQAYAAGSTRITIKAVKEFIGAAWNMIERDMNKEGLSSVPVELSPVEQQTVYRVLNDRWPTDCDKQMPAVVQNSMANCLSFYERVDKLKKSLDVAIEKFDDARPERVNGPDAQLYWFIKSLMASFGPVNLTVEQWLSKVRQRLNAVQESDPNGWKGNLLNWVWSEKNRIFADTYVDNTRIDKWTELMKRLTKEAQRGAQR